MRTFSVISRAAARCTGRLARAGVLAVAATLAGCSPEDLIDTEVPPNSPDPNVVNTPDGAADLYRGVISRFREATTGYTSGGPAVVVASALVSDELKTGQYRRGIEYDNT